MTEQAETVGFVYGEGWVKAEPSPPSAGAETAERQRRAQMGPCDRGPSGAIILEAWHDSLTGAPSTAQGGHGVMAR